jgi:subtilisin family serine protease
MHRIKTILFSLILFLTIQASVAQVADSNFVDGILYFKVKDTFSGNFDLTHPAMLGLVPLYHMDTCYRPFQGFGVDSLDRTYCLRFSDTAKMKLCRDTLRTLQQIDYVEQVPIRKTSFTPNDLNVNQWSLVKIGAQAAWGLSQGSANVVVAIVDNGVLLAHEDLAANLWVNSDEVAGNLLDDDFNGYSDDRNGADVADKDGNPNPPAGFPAGDLWNHGTHCAGIASAATNNSKGIASIGFNTKIMTVKCTSNSASNGGELTNTFDGITYAMRNGADVISMSFGSDQSSTTEQLILNTAHNNGIVLVAAAGNDNVSTPYYPASYANVISVGSTGQTDQKSGFSNYGATIDLMAPGESIYSTMGTGTTAYGFFSGTSMATPLVAGLSALVLAQHPTFTPAQVEAQLKSTCDNISVVNPTFTGQLGAGRINAFRALGGISDIEAQEFDNGVQVYPNPFNDQLIVKLSAVTETLECEWLDMQGRSCGKTIIPANQTTGELQTENLLSGVYILKITSGTNNSCRRVIKM